MEETILQSVKQFLDNDAKVKQMPVKAGKKLIILEYLSEKFEGGREYSEKEINALINDWHTFEDYCTIRRELVDYGFLSRQNKTYVKIQK